MSSDSDQKTEPMYRCTECGWTGDEYRVVDDGSTTGTAVCPECEGQLAIR